MKMIQKILSSCLHESLNSSYHVEADTQRIENFSDGSAAPIDEISLPSRAGGLHPRTPHDEDSQGAAMERSLHQFSCLEKRESK
ncbi:hypothetical protein E2N92_11170 [Methanofollis formosanus]|uniref:Uncharacterized protein n=1 Tax=Methanofollis formosanus TaxID=299308 RepID=A0A8G1A2F7_9EURY|nr:hypothetical protein [Methanofollis formosanus]QYZ79942.1 hypothetical protein E2N92_11170 [Methanofollis formosanus]